MKTPKTKLSQQFPTTFGGEEIQEESDDFLSRIINITEQHKKYQEGKGNTSLNKKNIQKAIDMNFALIEKITRDLLEKCHLKIQTPCINIWKQRTYYSPHNHTIYISPEQVNMSHGDIWLFIIIAHEYWHALLEEIGLNITTPPNIQEQFCDFFSGYCFNKLWSNFDIIDFQDIKDLKASFWYFGLYAESSSLHEWKPNIHGDGNQRASRALKWYLNDDDGIILCLKHLLDAPWVPLF